MQLIQRKLSGKTAIKYFLSYLIIFTVLIGGFFFIIRRQITNAYFEYRSEQARAQLDRIADIFKDNLTYLSQVDASLSSDLELIEGRYKDANGYNYQALMELREYASTTKIISSIVYLPKKTNIPLSTLLPVSYVDGVFYIRDSSMKTVSFDPSQYLGSLSGRIVFVSNEETSHLIYFPAISVRANYMFFYILDAQDLKQQLSGIASDEMPSIALVDSKNRIAVGVQEEALKNYLTDLPEENGIYRMDRATSLCIHTEKSKGFSIISLLSHDFLLQQINTAFASSYLALLLLSIFGFMLVILAMRITYVPLHRLTKKIVPDADRKLGYINQLEDAFTQAQTENEKLKEKVENYRLSMQKSLLDTIAVQNTSGDASSIEIDQLFSSSENNQLYILFLEKPKTGDAWEVIRSSISSALPDESAVILLEPRGEFAVFLINYAGEDDKKDLKLKAVCEGLYEDFGSRVAVSEGSESLLDIPALYENAKYAKNFWPEKPVSEFRSLPKAEASYQYPHDKLNSLTGLLNENDFAKTRELVSELFRLTDLYTAKTGTLTNFFVQCVLIDVLTVITNYMNLAYIKFYDYCELYFETLYFCRNCPYSEKASDIKRNIGKLIDFCEQQISEKSITSAPLIAQIEECYCQSDFSISVLADKFHVSVAYMSFLFKKELNVNFSDYLWMMRKKKAQELLKTTDLSIDEISLAVGYQNPSSFRRKFKQETGVTPSQYRSGTEDS